MTVRGVIGGKKLGTDTNAETLTKQKLPVLVAFRNQECTHYKIHRRNNKGHMQVAGIE